MWKLKRKVSIGEPKHCFLTFQRHYWGNTLLGGSGYTILRCVRKWKQLVGVKKIEEINTNKYEIIFFLKFQFYILTQSYKPWGVEQILNRPHISPRLILRSPIILTCILKPDIFLKSKFHSRLYNDKLLLKYFNAVILEIRNSVLR